MFGLVERMSSKCFLIIVPNRKAETLLAIIYDHVEKGSTIISDSRSSYNKIAQFKDFSHLTVNHSCQFLDPITGAHTNNIIYRDLK